MQHPDAYHCRRMYSPGLFKASAVAHRLCRFAGTFSQPRVKTWATPADPLEGQSTNACVNSYEPHSGGFSVWQRLKTGMH